MSLPDEPESVALEQLSLDPQNPRIPLKLRGGPEIELLHYIARNYNAIAIAESIARFGYFPSEPMVALRRDDGALYILKGIDASLL